MGSAEGRSAEAVGGNRHMESDGRDRHSTNGRAIGTTRLAAGIATLREAVGNADAPDIEAT